MAWKIKFDEEKRLERKALKMKEPDANKLTGDWSIYYSMHMCSKAM